MNTSPSDSDAVYWIEIIFVDFIDVLTPANRSQTLHKAP